MRHGRFGTSRRGIPVLSNAVPPPPSPVPPLPPGRDGFIVASPTVLWVCTEDGAGPVITLGNDNGPRTAVSKYYLLAPGEALNFQGDSIIDVGDTSSWDLTGVSFTVGQQAVAFAAYPFVISFSVEFPP